MLRHLRAVNVDANTVGWYQSTYMGSYHTEQLIETFLSYAENIQRCVCLVYDPLRSQHGALALKALRLTDAFLELYRSGEVTTERVQEKGITWSDVLTEIPITVQNSTLASSLMRCCAPGPESVTEQDLDRLNMSTYPFLERNMEFLVDCMDDLQLEAQKQAQYQRAVQRQQQQQAQWLQRRRQENSSRQAQGLEPLPEEDPSNPIFKLPNEPSRLDELLVTNQVSNYCWQVDRFSKQARCLSCLLLGFGSEMTFHSFQLRLPLSSFECRAWRSCKCWRASTGEGHHLLLSSPPLID